MSDIELAGSVEQTSGTKGGVREIFEIVSDLIYLHHPITMDIRYEFCRILSILDGRGDKCWDSREEWEKVVSTYHYTGDDVFFILEDKERTRENAIRVLSAERDRLLKDFDNFDCFCKSCQKRNLFKELKPGHLCPQCGTKYEIRLYADID